MPHSIGNPSQIKSKHTKHTALEKPIGGNFHFNEWSIIGAPCDLITELAEKLGQVMPGIKVGYLDAAHENADMPGPFHSRYNNRGQHAELLTSNQLEEKQSRKHFAHLDLLLINGNHYNGAKQIVVITEEKKESLSKKLDRLTDVRIVIVKKFSDDIHDFILPIVSEKDDVQYFRLDHVEKIANAIMEEMKVASPPLYGMVLSGGRSQRMGTDKGAISYHGKPQREYEADILKRHCNRIFISCRTNQDELIETTYAKLYDTFTGLGPYGGILSAFREHPNAAWLTLACDLPYLDESTIKQLVAGRDTTKSATCFYNPDTDFPEPLITIWEPRAYPILLEFLSQGYSCPRKVLINSDVKILEMKDVTKMSNVNNVEEAEAAQSFFNSSRN